MNFLSVFLIAAGLSADAFSVALIKGMSMKKVKFLSAFFISFMFGFFQFFMSYLGNLSGAFASVLFYEYSNLLAFFILFIIGAKMIYDTVLNTVLDDGKINFLNILLSAIATSIDALAVGITLANFESNVLRVSGVIGITAFLFSFAGVYLGKICSSYLGKYSEITGGIILILMAFKFLFTSLF